MIGISLRRSLGLPFLVVALSAGIFAAQGYYSSGGSFIWPVAASSFGLSLQLLGPVAGGLAAYAGGRPRRQGLLTWEMLSVRGQSCAALVDLGAYLSWMLVALFVVMLRIYLPAALHATAGHLPVLRTVDVYLGLALITCFGYVVGRLFPYRLTALGVAVVVYVATDLGYGKFYDYGLFFPVDLNSYDTYSGPRASAGVGQLLWFTGISVLFIAGWSWQRRVSYRPWVAALVGSALVASGALVLVPLHGRAYAAERITWVCTGSPQLCLNPAFTAGRARIWHQLAPVEARLADTPYAITRLEQRPRGVGSTPREGAIAFALDDLRPVSLKALPEDVAINALGVDGPSCFHNFGSRGYDLSRVVATQVVTGTAKASATSEPSVKAAAQWYNSLRPVNQRMWLTTHRSALSSCTLRVDAFE